MYMKKKIKTTMKNATAYFDGIDKSVINKNIDSAKQNKTYTSLILVEKKTEVQRTIFKNLK